MANPVTPGVVRYPFPVPEWCRVMWASAEGKALWEPRLQQIGRAWSALELSSVGQVRGVCRQNVMPSQLPELAAKAAARHLMVVPLAQERRVQGYRSAAEPLRPGDPWDYQVIVGRAKEVEVFLEARAANDEAEIGALLGYPTCCTDFYKRVWVEEGWRDTTWPMAGATPCPDDPSAYNTPSGTRVVTGPVECNILLRWLGVRWSFHLPCSFQCPETAKLGSALRTLLSHDCPEEAGWIDELLSMPVQWSAWHGIAEVVHPLLKISAKTDATGDRLVVKREGSAKPAAVPAPVPMTLISRAKPQPDSTEWTDNGFSSMESMVQAHRTIIRVASLVTPEVQSVLDLGCGNGRLARAIVGRDGFAVGIEQDPERALRAHRHLGNGNVAVGTIVERFPGAWGTDFDLILLMPGRLLEIEDRDRRRALVEQLRNSRARVLVYTYPSPDTRSLKVLIDHAGMRATIPFHDWYRGEDGTAAGLLEWLP